jgi:hypothetical protein
VLVACEFSGTVRDAFQARGHDATSCDLLDTEKPGPHIVGDCMDVIAEGGWDLIVMHPPCTALAVSGNRWYSTGMPKHAERVQAIQWTMALWDTACAASTRVCMENPVGVLPIKPTQYVQPWQFGHGETKRTGLWLHGLAPLQPTDVVDGREARVHRMPPSDTRWMERSRTYTGIAEAMADQWGAPTTDRLAEIRARLDGTRALIRSDVPTPLLNDLEWLLDRVTEQDEHLRAISADLADSVRP